jgi:hypothetical protein
MVCLAPKYGIRYTSGFSLRWRLYLLLTPRCRGNGIIRRTIGNALECVGDARQLPRNLIGSARPFQHDNPFSAEVENRPEQQSGHDGHRHHQHVVTRDGDASACDGNQVIRKQSFLPAGLKVRVHAVAFGPPRSTALRGRVVRTATAYC